jgi:hypothetical protein
MLHVHAARAYLILGNTLTFILATRALFRLLQPIGRAYTLEPYLSLPPLLLGLIRLDYLINYGTICLILATQALFVLVYVTR